MLTTVFVLVLPGAQGIHHALLAYPLPHLLVVVALVTFVRSGAPERRSRRAALVFALTALLLASDLRVVHATQRLIDETGGRGYWSSTIDDFAREVRERTDLTVVSLDWGFNEQLILLTDGPRLWEPIWGLPPRPPLDGCDSSDRIYLAHPPALTVMPLAAGYLRDCRARHAAKLLVRPYRDRQGAIVFYAIRFAPQ